MPLSDRTWEWVLPTGEKVAARVIAATKREMVRVEGQVASIAGPGERPDGHVFRLAPVTLEPPKGGDVFRAPAVPGPEREVRVRFDGSQFHLTVDGQVIAPQVKVATPEPEEPPERAARPRAVVARLRAAPRWSLPFIAACAIMPIASLGGLVPSLIGLGCAAGVLAVTEKLRDRRAVAIAASSGLVVVCWSYFFVAALGLGSVLYGRKVSACRFDPLRVYVFTKEGVFDPADPASVCVDARAERTSGLRGRIAVRPSDGALVFIHDGQLSRAVAGNGIVPSCNSRVPLPSTFATPTCGCASAKEGRVFSMLTAPDSDRVVYTCHSATRVPPRYANLLPRGSVGTTMAQVWHQTGGEDLVVPEAQDVIAIGRGGTALAATPDGFAVFEGGVAHRLRGEWPKSAEGLERVARAVDDGFLLAASEMLQAQVPGIVHDGIEITAPQKGRYARRLWKVDRAGNVTQKGTYSDAVEDVLNGVLDASGNLYQVGGAGVIRFAPDERPADVVLDAERAAKAGVSLEDAQVVSGP